MKKVQNTCQDNTIALGLDVDANKSAVCALNINNGTIEFEGNIRHDEEKWRKFLERFEGKTVWSCYEAGCTGFSLCRMLRNMGVDCQVAAPSAVPKAPINKQIKTDRRDAWMLAQLFINRPRTFVRVPTVEEESDRQLIRTREQMVKEKIRIKAELKSLLLVQNIRPSSSEKLRIQGKNYFIWLKSLDLCSSLRSSLNTYIETLENLEKQIRALDRQIAARSKTPKYHDRNKRLLQIPGVGVLTSMTFLLEVFRPEEFPNAPCLASHVGLTQSQHSTGGVTHYGHITHWGPPHLRRILVEASWVWIRYDENARRRYYEIRAGKERKRAIVAMARHLAIVMWAMTVKEQDYNYQWYIKPQAA